MKSLIKSPLHGLAGKSFAVITVTGRKTGKIYEVPLNVTPSGGGYFATSLRGRTWWRNLRGGVEACLLIGGRRLPVRGEVIEAPEAVVAELEQYFIQNPGLARYFDVKTGPDGCPDLADLARAATVRVAIRLRPIGL
jgi:hypothetical protein